MVLKIRSLALMLLLLMAFSGVVYGQYNTNQADPISNSLKSSNYEKGNFVIKPTLGESLGESKPNWRLDAQGNIVDYNNLNPTTPSYKAAKEAFLAEGPEHPFLNKDYFKDVDNLIALKEAMIGDPFTRTVAQMKLAADLGIAIGSYLEYGIIAEEVFGPTTTQELLQDAKDHNSALQGNFIKAESNFGGINFTSIKLNYISVNEDSSGNIDFDYLFRAQKAEGTSPRIDFNDSTSLGLTAFMTGLAVPDDKFWVNLNPWGPDEIIDERLKQSEIGRIMLEADLQMKRDFSNYENPCANETGKTYWNFLDKKRKDLVQQCMKKFPGEIKDIYNVQFHVMTRHEIIPDKVYAYTNGTQIYIINATLTINSELNTDTTDHWSFSVRNQDNATLSIGCLDELKKSVKEYGEYNSELEMSMIQPYIVADVNHGKKYEDLRNVYVALALAQWYKSRIDPSMDIFRGSLNPSGILESQNQWSPKEIWDQYVYSFYNGEYKCRQNTTTETSLFRGGGVEFDSIRDHIVEIKEIPPEIQDHIERAVLDGYMDEEKDVLVGNRHHVITQQNTTATDSSSIAEGEAIRPDTDLSLEWSNKGNDLGQQGKNDEAIMAYEEAIRLDPNDVTAWYNKGMTLDSQGKYDEAIMAYDEVIRLDPNDGHVWISKGNALEAQGKHDEALKALDEAAKAFDEAIEMNPNNFEDWMNKGFVLSKQGKYDESIKAYDEAIRLDPNLSLIWNEKGKALKALGKTTESDAAFAKAKELGYSG